MNSTASHASSGVPPELTQRLERWFDVAARRPVLTLSLTLLLSIAKSGLWLVPSIDEILLIASDPTRVLLPPNMHWLYGSFLGPAIAHVLDLSERPIAFAAINLLIVVIAYYACGIAILRKYGARCCVLFALLFAAAPISNPLLNWLGYADAVTFAAMTAIVIGAPAWFVLILGIVLGLNHFEQGLVFLGIFLLFAGMTGMLRDARNTFIMLAVGLLTGRGVLLFYFASMDMTLHMTRFSYAIGHSGRLFRLGMNLLSNPLVLIWSLFSGLWLYVWQLLGTQTPLAIKRAALLAFLVCAAPVMLVADATRVFAILSWPVLVLTLIKAAPAWSTIKRQAVFGALLVAAFIPQIMVWDGWIYSSASLHTVQFAKRYFVNGEREITRERVRKAFIDNSARWRSREEE